MSYIQAGERKGILCEQKSELKLNVPASLVPPGLSGLGASGAVQGLQVSLTRTLPQKATRARLPARDERPAGGSEQ